MNDNKTYYLYGKINKAVYALLLFFLYLLHICSIYCLSKIILYEQFNKSFIEFVSQYVLLQKTVLQSLLFEYFSEVIIVQTAVVTRTSRLIQCTYSYIVFFIFCNIIGNTEMIVH